MPEGEARGEGQRGRSKGKARGGDQKGMPEGETKGEGQRGRSKGKARGGGQRGMPKGEAKLSPPISLPCSSATNTHGPMPP